MFFIVTFSKLFRFYLSVLLLVHCVSSVVFLSIALSGEGLVDSYFLCDKAAVLDETAQQRAEYSKDAEE